MVDKNTTLQLQRLESRIRALERGRSDFSIEKALSRDLVDVGSVPICRLSQTSVQSIVGSTYTTVTMDVIDFDFFDGGGASLANDNITIRRDGIYITVGQLLLAGDAAPVAGSTGIAELRLNGSAINTYTQQGGFASVANHGHRLSFTDVRTLLLGDTVALGAWQSIKDPLNTLVSGTWRSWICVLLVATTG